VHAPTPPPAPTADLNRPSFGAALRFWTLLGFISFGGTAGHIAIMHDELVERRRWIDEARFVHALSYCFALPGPEAQQLATYVGWRLHGTRGALAAGTLFFLPGFIALCALAYAYVAYGHLETVAGVVRALGGAVVGIVLAALIRIGGRIARTRPAIAMAIAVFVLAVAGVPFPLIVIGTAVVGIVVDRIVPGSFAPTGDDADHERTPHRFNWRRTATILLAWIVPSAGLLAVGGVVADVTGLFTITAVVSFGGAYAVLAFVATQAVEHLRWATTTDIVAGFGLGETTPGPLVLVNTFVGYLAGWSVHGSHGWALVTASVATFCTFAPSFVYILIGAPFIDAMPRTGPVASALSGVSAAIVGVIGGLAVFIGRHALFPDGDVDVLAVVVAAGAFIAVWRLRTNVALVVAGAALLGLVTTVT